VERRGTFEEIDDHLKHWSGRLQGNAMEEKKGKEVQSMIGGKAPDPDAFLKNLEEGLELNKGKRGRDQEKRQKERNPATGELRRK